jgi:hypothetical protein
VSQQSFDLLASDVAIWVGDELLRRAGLESAPDSFWGAAKRREEAAWLKGRDDTVALINDELEGHVRTALERAERRIEYRVVGDRDGATTTIRDSIFDRAEAERIAFSPPGWPAFENVRIQQQAVLEVSSPWEEALDV